MRADDQGLILILMKPNHNLLLMTRHQEKKIVGARIRDRLRILSLYIYFVIQGWSDILTFFEPNLNHRAVSFSKQSWHHHYSIDHNVMNNVSKTVSKKWLNVKST